MPTAKPAFAVKRVIAPELVDKVQGQKMAEALHQRLSERAYALYEQSGRQDGNDETNWLQAKSEMMRGIEARQSGTWVALTASIPQSSPESIRVCVDARRVLVQVEKAASATGVEQLAPGPSSIFFAADLDVEVDPASAAAAFKDATLNLMIKKVNRR